MTDSEQYTSSVSLLEGVREIADRYDAFVIDQWGVLHDGRSAYPGAIQCLLQLRSRGKLTVILSNSGKRASANEARLAALGFERGSYSEVITSGDVAWEALKIKADPFYRSLGRRCLLLSSDGDTSILEGLAFEVVDDLNCADFILLSGCDENGRDGLLERAAARNVPMICANPDLTRLVNGHLAAAPGAIALSYQRLGGEVHYVGKPYPEVYASCLAFLSGCPIERIVAIGDSLQHDVAGGNRAGLDTVFVSSGVHRNDFSETCDNAAKTARLAELITSHGVQPRWMLPSLVW